MSNTLKLGCDVECTPLQTHTFQSNNGVNRMANNIVVPVASVAVTVALPLYSIILGTFKNPSTGGAVNNGFPSLASTWTALELLNSGGVGASDISFVDNSNVGGTQKFNYIEYDLHRMRIETPPNVSSMLKVMEYINSLGFLTCQMFKQNGIYNAGFNQTRDILLQDSSAVISYTCSIVWIDYSWLFR